MNPMLSQVLSQLQPSVKAKEIAQEVQRQLQDLGGEVIFSVGGSLAKNTHLKGNHDCDIFARFPKKYNNDTLSDELEQILITSPYNIQRVHGSRDYFQFSLKGVEFEIVPVYAITNAKDAKNVTDCSYLHILWANKEVNKKKNGMLLADHIRLAKKFCKAQRVYGAESYIGGISGHVLDILVIHYGGFEEFLKAASVWDTQDKIIVDTKKYYASDSKILSALNEAKVLSPLIVVDPIDKARNAAAALTLEKFEKLIVAAKKYTNNPSKNFFTKKPIRLSAPQNGEVFTFEIKPLEGKKDVVGAKMLKASQYISKQLKHYDFEVLRQEFTWDQDKAKCYIAVGQKTLSPQCLQQGPPITSEHALAFKKKHPKAFIQGSRLYAHQKREFRSAKKLVLHTIKQEYVLSKVAQIRLL